MSRPFLRRFFVLTALAVSGCGEPSTEPVTLVDFDFGRAREDSIYGEVWGADRGLHTFDSGWSMARAGNFWTRGARAQMHLQLEGRKARLRMVLTSLPDLVAAGQTVTLELNGQTLVEHVLEGQRPDTLDVDLPDDSWQPGANALVVKPGRWHSKPKDFGVSIRRLQVQARLTAEQRRRWDALNTPPPLDTGSESIFLPDGEATKASSAEQPDLLLFLMDTTRADRISSYGHDRATSPVIDQLAAGGVRLENVIAEAPYTLSSVASLFTGRSWRDHRVLVEGDALSADFITLAEILQGAGYRTICISDNPNVARVTRLTQGFDEVYETFSDEERAALGLSGYAPEGPELRLRERLDRELPAAPTFVYVHTMMPHGPYFPGEEHDLWRPSGYAGPIDGATAQIHEFNRGERPASGPDYERLWTLYDGSIHRGDASIGRMLDAWRAAGRKRPTLVAVMSDHGEGFGEHGMFAHATTPYDEMLHVPVVLYPASLAAGAAQNPRALRTLSDVMPLILHSLGVSLPPATAWPRRVLDVLHEPSSPRERIFVRCHRPLFALRTPRSLTVLAGWNRQEYYDLAADPGAQKDLRWTRPQPYLEQLSILRGFVESAGIDASPERADLSPEDIERLKALGYM